MTESELLASPDFIAWCRVWEKDRHCPLPFADWALENVGELAFEACVWAHEKEERKGHRVNPGLVYAWVSIRSHDWGCWNVPIAEVCNLRTDNSYPAAIAYYITHFDRELAAKYPPKRALATV